MRSHKYCSLCMFKYETSSTVVRNSYGSVYESCRAVLFRISVKRKHLLTGHSLGSCCSEGLRRPDTASYVLIATTFPVINYIA